MWVVREPCYPLTEVDLQDLFKPWGYEDQFERIAVNLINGKKEWQTQFELDVKCKFPIVAPQLVWTDTKEQASFSIRGLLLPPERTRQMAGDGSHLCAVGGPAAVTLSYHFILGHAIDHLATEVVHERHAWVTAAGMSKMSDLVATITATLHGTNLRKPAKSAVSCENLRLPNASVWKRAASATTCENL